MTENIQHHIEEEEGQMFDKQARSVFDRAELEELGEQMEARRQTAKAQMGSTSRPDRRT